MRLWSRIKGEGKEKRYAPSVFGTSLGSKDGRRRGINKRRRSPRILFFHGHPLKTPQLLSRLQGRVGEGVRGEASGRAGLKKKPFVILMSSIVRRRSKEGRLMKEGERIREARRQRAGGWHFILKFVKKKMWKFQRCQSKRRFQHCLSAGPAPRHGHRLPLSKTPGPPSLGSWTLFWQPSTAAH